MRLFAGGALSLCLVGVASAQPAPEPASGPPSATPANTAPYVPPPSGYTPPPPYGYAPPPPMYMQPQPPPPDPVTPGRVLGQTGGGLLGVTGGLGVVATAWVIGLLSCYDSISDEDTDRNCDLDSTGWKIAFGLGAGVGAGLGVWLTGLNDHANGSLGVTLLAGAVGGIASVYLVDDDYSPRENTLIFALPAVTAVIGYYATRDYASSAPPPPPRNVPAMPALAPREGTVVMPLGSFSF